MIVDAEWVGAVAESVMALGLILALLQLRVSHKQVVADHERSRRELAVQYLLTWTNSVSRQMSAASRLADIIGFDACHKIAQRQSVEIDRSNHELLSVCFPAGTAFVENEGKLILSEAQSIEFRVLLVGLLNILETILCAWCYATVRRDIIEKEFAYLLESRDGRKLLKDFRQATGDHKYPAIAAFESHMEHMKHGKAEKFGEDEIYPMGRN